MRKCNLCKKVILVSGLTLTMLMTACSGSEKPGDMLIGSWVSEYNDIVTFEKDMKKATERSLLIRMEWHML